MKLKYTWIPFILELIIITVFRLYQFITIGDVSVRVQWDNIELVSAFTSSIAVLIIIIMTYLSKDAPKFFILQEDKITGTVGCLAGVMVMCHSVSDFLSFLLSSKELMRLFSGVFGLAAGLVFIIMGICNIKGKDYFEKYRLLTLVPTLWALMSLLNTFFKYNSIPTTATNVINVLDEIFLVFFLFYQARMFANLFDEATFKKLFYCGFSAVIFMTLNAFGQFLTIMNSGATISLVDFIYIVAEIIIAVYALCFIFGIKLEQEVDILYEDEPMDIDVEAKDNNAKKPIDIEAKDNSAKEPVEIENDDNDEIEEINKIIESLNDNPQEGGHPNLEDDERLANWDIKKISKLLKTWSENSEYNIDEDLQNGNPIDDGIKKINSLIKSLDNKEPKEDSHQDLQNGNDAISDSIKKINKVLEKKPAKKGPQKSQEDEAAVEDSVEKVNKLIVGLSNQPKKDTPHETQDNKNDPADEEDDIEEINKIIEYIQNEEQTHEEDSAKVQEAN